MSPAARLAMLAVVAVTPAFLNDFLYIRAAAVSDWLIADYGSKLLVGAMILTLPDTRRALAGAWSRAPFRRADWHQPMALALAVAGIVVTAFLYLKPPLDILAPDMILFDYPDIENPAVRTFDLTLGLVLTAVVEEMAFRGLARRVMENVTENVIVVVVASAAIFAAIHWSNGLGSLAVTFVAGVLLMALYIRSGSLWPPVIAHYLANLALFI